MNRLGSETRTFIRFTFLQRIPHPLELRTQLLTLFVGDVQGRQKAPDAPLQILDGIAKAVIVAGVRDTDAMQTRTGPALVGRIIPSIIDLDVECQIPTCRFQQFALLEFRQLRRLKLLDQLTEIITHYLKMRSFRNRNFLRLRASQIWSANRSAKPSTGPAASLIS